MNFDRDGQGISKNPQAKGLLGAGWRPLSRNLDMGHLSHLLLNDTAELAQKALDVASDMANALGRSEYAWWANALNLFSEGMRYEVDEFWNYITPDPLSPDYRYKDTLWSERPITQSVSRNCIPIDFVLNRLREIIIMRILAILGRPDMITQYYMDRHFYYPNSRFTTWDRLDVPGIVYAYWEAHEVWLTIQPSNENRGKQFYNLIAQDLAPLINKASYNLAVMLSGYQSRIGQISSQFAIRSFPESVRSFTDMVQQAILEQQHLAVLVHGEPGTGKTAWTQAVAQEILLPLGYVIFILDHDAVENFVPPTYLERICLIINEADNLAQNRATEAAQSNNKTEHILSLLDGTLYQSVIDEAGIQTHQKLVILMTCNTTERLDPAVLRKGRVDLMAEFIHRFV
jgi:hypothetical protein